MCLCADVGALVNVGVDDAPLVVDVGASVDGVHIVLSGDRVALVDGGVDIKEVLGLDVDEELCVNGSGEQHIGDVSPPKSRFSKFS